MRLLLGAGANALADNGAGVEALDDAAAGTSTSSSSSLCGIGLDSLQSSGFYGCHWLRALIIRFVSTPKSMKHINMRIM